MSNFGGTRAPSASGFVPSVPRSQALSFEVRLGEAAAPNELLKLLYDVAVVAGPLAPVMMGLHEKLVPWVLSQDLTAAAAGPGPDGGGVSEQQVVRVPFADLVHTLQEDRADARSDSNRLADACDELRAWKDQASNELEVLKAQLSDQKAREAAWMADKESLTTQIAAVQQQAQTTKQDLTSNILALHRELKSVDEANEYCHHQVAELKAYKDKFEGLRYLFEDMQRRKRNTVEPTAGASKAGGRGGRNGRVGDGGGQGVHAGEDDPLVKDMAEVATLLAQIQLLHNAHITEYEESLAVASQPSRVRLKRIFVRDARHVLDEQTRLSDVFEGLQVEYAKASGGKPLPAHLVLPGTGGGGRSGGSSGEAGGEAGGDAGGGGASPRSKGSASPTAHVEDGLLWKHYLKRGGKLPPRCPRPSFRLGSLLAVISEVFHAAVNIDRAAAIELRDHDEESYAEARKRQITEKLQDAASSASHASSGSSGPRSGRGVGAAAGAGRGAGAGSSVEASPRAPARIGDVTPLYDFLPDYMEDKYGVREVALNVVHAVLQGLERNRHGRLRVQLCSQALCGLCDESAWRIVMEYERILHDHVQKKESMRRPAHGLGGAPGGFGRGTTAQEIADLLYPSWPSDKRRECAAMITKMAAEMRVANEEQEVPVTRAALEYLTWQVMDGSELRIVRMREALRSHDRYRAGRFTLSEFQGLAARAVPRDPIVRRLATRFFRVSARTLTGSASSPVPIDRLAIVMTLLDLRVCEASDGSLGSRGASPAHD